MGQVHQHQAKPPGHALTRPAPAQTVGRSPASPQLQSAQSAYGNQAVNRLMESRAVQAKMEVTPPSDSYEQEAEHVADQVTRMSDPGPVSAATPQVHRLAETVSRAGKDDKKKDAGGKKKDDTKVKRAADKDDKKDDKKKKDDKVKRAEDKDKDQDKKKKPEEEQVKRAEAKDDKKKDAKKDDKKKDDEKVKRAGDKDEKKDAKDAKQESKEDDKKKDDDKVKRAAEQSETKEDDDEKVQRAATAEAESVPEVTPEVERGIQAQRSSGQPLPESLRSHFEPRFGKDLSNVRLHTDSRAAESAKKLKAQAFTHGQDIYFGQGKYQPQAESGKHLLAHEITHTLQQSGGAQAPAGPAHAQGPGTGPLVSRGVESSGLVQRNGTGTGTPAAAPTQGTTAGQSLETGMLDGDTITFDFVKVPGFKKKAHRGALYDAQVLKQRKGYSRGSPQQRDVWKEKLGAQTEAIQTELKKKSEDAKAKDKDKSGAAAAAGPMAFVAPGNRFFIGDLPTIAKEMTLPYWSRTGKFQRYDVDHIVELQLADWGGSGAANDIPNMELLDPKTNQQSGVDVKNNIGEKVKKFIDSTNGQYGKNVGDIKSNYNVVFQKANGEGEPADVSDELFWKPSEITQGLQVKNDKITPKNSLNPSDPDTVYVFPSTAGGVPKSFPSKGGSADWPKPFKTTSATFDTAPESVSSPKFGTMEIEIPASHKHFKPLQDKVELTRIPGAQFAGVLDKSVIRAKMAQLQHKKMSPIEVEDLDIDPEMGVTLTGAIKPDIPILEGKQIDFQLSGDDITISMEFGTGDLKVPKPFLVKSSTIKIFASTGKGLGADGRVDFGIEKVGDGFLAASVGTSEGLNVAGEFNFDSKLFDPAKIALSYEDKQFKASGQLGIPEGKVKGIKTATITASYDAGTFKASGTAELTIPGVKKGALNVEYSEAAGFKIGGDFTLADNIPGLKGGSAKVAVEQGDEGYKVKADITAQPAIPGIDSELKGTYDDGAIDLSVSATYTRGIATGTLSLGATNRAVDDDGKPSGKGGDKFSAYGSGEVTLKLTTWLQGTVGVKVKPNAEMVFKGKLGLPSSIDVFPKKEVKQTLFSLNMPIPIFPPIIAEIGGSLEATASFGPGQLKDLSVEVTYNPDKEDDTVVEGKGQFEVPAEAGLALSVHAGVGASVAVASLTGGIDVSGGLGIQGKASAGVDVVWNPKTGVDLKGEVTASAEPKFVFKINGYVKAEVGVSALSYTLYEHKWNLANFEYGSGLRFGITLPIHYNSNQPFDIKFEDIKVEKPEIDTTQMIKDLLAKVSD